jgi:hypothetical protein
VNIKLSAEDQKRINDVFPPGSASGHRYYEGAVAALNR